MDKITLNPEIKKQADKLFKLIEDETEKHHDDEVAGAMEAEWGEYLKTSKGFHQLEYAKELTLTESERARLNLEEAFWQMDDETASLVFTVSDYGCRVSEAWKRIKNKEDDFHSLEMLIRYLGEESKKMRDKVDSLFMYRARRYREELEELKKAV
ncbi:MAG TPA: hypothetical protein DD671_10605 [Balneolaceae bacterium]|nr:hypothetical protein [Balneolaceae bacterium]